MKKILRIGIVLFLIMGLGTGILYLVSKQPREVYVNALREGYVTARSLNQVLFFSPSGFESKNFISDITKLDASKDYRYEAENKFALFCPNEYILYAAVIKDDGWKDYEDAFKALERETKLRVTNHDKGLNGEEGGIKKTIFNANISAMYTSDVFADYVGQISIIKKDNKACFLVVAKTNETELKDVDMQYISKSLQYIDYHTAINPSSKVLGVEKNYKFSQNPLSVGEFGVAKVTNKMDRTEMIDTAVSVIKINPDASSEIENSLENTIYSKLPDATEGKTWKTATIKYSFLGYDVSEVLPYVNVTVQEKDAKSKTYFLSNSEPNEKGEYTLVIFYESGEEYKLIIGDGKEKTEVEVVPKEIQDKETKEKSKE